MLVKVSCLIFLFNSQHLSRFHEIKANRPEPYHDVYKHFAHDQSSLVVTGIKKMNKLIQELKFATYLLRNLTK